MVAEPANDVVEAGKAVQRLATARKFVPFIGEAHHLHRAPQILERGEKLLPLLDGAQRRSHSR